MTGSTFIRALTALNGDRAPVSQDAFAQRLSRWFDWTHAIALSTALSEAPSRPAAVNADTVGSGSSADEREYARVRAALVQLITDATVGAADSPTAQRPDRSLADGAGFAAHAQRYAACQQAMTLQIAALRSRLRASLARGPAARAKLAELDGLMEQVLGVQERLLLSTMASRLAPRFQQLQEQHRPVAVTLPGEPPDLARSLRWLKPFLHEMQSLLLAELDLRLQPVAGLLDAGRPPSTTASP